MKRKVKRYNEGELVDSFSEYQGFGQMGPRTIQEDINAEEENRKPQMRESISVSEFEEPGTAGFSKTAIRQPAARPKPVTVPVAKPSLAKPAAVKVAEKPMGRTAMGKTADMEMQALARADLERRKSLDKPLERVNPEENLMGGSAIKGLKGLGAGIAAIKETLKPKPKTAGQLGFSGKQADKLTKDMGPVEFATQRNKRRQLTGNRRSDDVIEMGMKKGGKVGSASRRADGIAMRGKTRGKYI